MLWELTRRDQPKTLCNHDEPIAALTFSPDGNLLAAGSRDGKVILWDLTQVSHKSLDGCSGEVKILAFSPYSDRIASFSTDKTITLWEVETGEEIEKFPVGYHIDALLFNATGTSLETGRKQFQLPLQHDRKQTEPPPHYGRVQSCSPYSLDEKLHWVTWNGHNVLFLPSDRRPTDEDVYAIRDNCPAIGHKPDRLTCLAIGHKSGRLTIIRFDPHST